VPELELLKVVFDQNLVVMYLKFNNNFKMNSNVHKSDAVSYLLALILQVFI
jgi:hypothetical protein